MRRILYLFTVCIYCLSACSYSSDEELRQALRVSGKNRAELEAVLNHYKNDSLKLEAARFLIKYMPYHHSKEEYYLSPDGNKYRPDLTSFKGKEETQKHCDSLIQCGYRIEQYNIRDITSLDSAFLVNNIDLAFSVWKKPWAKNISFDDFCRYILPYRARTEQVSFLRKEMKERFIHILDSAEVSTPLAACVLLNAHLRKVIRYQDTGLPLYPTIEETYRAGISRCEGICNLGTFIMRAVGIPIAVDFTIWAKMDLGHSWCAVLNNGRFYCFGPGEDQPDVHASSFSKKNLGILPKVYRSQFDLINYDRKTRDDGYKTFLKSPLTYDVTDEYSDKTISIKIPAENRNITRDRLPDQVYLCVYNHYKWEPIDMGTYSDSDICVFNNVIGNNIFIVADCPDGKNLRYITAPFHVNETGVIHPLIPNTQQRQTCVLQKQKNRENVNHTLFYWDVNAKRFMAIACKEATDLTQTYNQIPANALLWFTVPEHVLNQRVFFIENDKIKIY